MCLNPYHAAAMAATEALAQYRVQAALDAEQAAATLSEIVAKSTGATIDPDALARLISEKWATLTTLAHKIHEGRQT